MKIVNMLPTRAGLSGPSYSCPSGAISPLSPVPSKDGYPVRRELRVLALVATLVGGGAILSANPEQISRVAVAVEKADDKPRSPKAKDETIVGLVMKIEDRAAGMQKETARRAALDADESMDAPVRAQLLAALLSAKSETETDAALAEAQVLHEHIKNKETSTEAKERKE